MIHPRSTPRAKQAYHQWIALMAGAFTTLAMATKTHADITAEWLATSGGTWITAADWSTAPVSPNNGSPAGAAYQALIDLPGSAPYTVTLATSIALDGLTLNSATATLSQSNGTFTVPTLAIDAGDYLLKGGTLSGGSGGGTVTISPGALFQANGGTLDRLTFSGSNIGLSGTVHITNGLNLSGNSLNIAGTFSTLYFDGSSQTINNISINNTSIIGTLIVGGAASTGAVTLTLGTAASVSGAATFSSFKTTGVLINDGTFNADLKGQTLAISTASFTNHGLAEATGGGLLAINGTSWSNAADGTISANASTLTLGGAWTNAGTINALAGSTVNLGGTFASTDIGTITSSSDSTVNITGTLTNGSGTLTFANTSTVWNLAGGTIQFGTVSFGNNLNIANGTLSSVTVAQGGSVNVPSNGILTMSGNWNNLGAINAAANSTLNLAGAFTTPHIGTMNAAPTATVNLSGTLTNTGSTLILPFPFNLTGTISGGTVGSGFTMNGSLAGDIAPGVSVNSQSGTLFGNWINQGTLNVSATGFLRLSGTFTTAAIGVLNVASGGNVTLSGTLDNTGSTFVPTPAWHMFGTITGGSIAGPLEVDSIATFTDASVAAGATITNGQNSGPSFGGTWSNAGTIASDAASVILGGTWSNSGTISTTNENELSNKQTLLQGTWSNTGTISASDFSNVTLQGTWSNTGTLTVSNHSTMSLGGAISLSTSGAINESSDSTINLIGTLTMGPNETLAPTGTFNLNGGTIVGGTVKLAPSFSLGIVSGSTLSGVQVVGGDIFTAATANTGTTLDVQNGLNLNGNSIFIQINSNIDFESTQTIDNANIFLRTQGEAGIVFLNYFAANPAAETVTLGPGTTLTAGNNAQFWGGALVNNGTITADHFGSAALLTIQNVSLVNNHIATAINGGEILFTSVNHLTNNGSLIADGANCTVDLQTANWTNSPGATLGASNGGVLWLRGGGANAGTITISSATANIQGTPFLNTGTLNLANATLNISGGQLLVGNGTLTGSGTINGDVALSSDPSHLLFNIGGTTPGSGYDTLIVNGNVSLSGELDIRFANGFQSSITPDETFTLLAVGGGDALTGTFTNVGDAGSLITADGYGSFQVHYGSGPSAGEIVLSNFVLAPEPASLSVVTLGLAGGLLRRRPRPSQRTRDQS